MTCKFRKPTGKTLSKEENPTSYMYSENDCTNDEFQIQSQRKKKPIRTHSATVHTP